MNSDAEHLSLEKKLEHGWTLELTTEQRTKTVDLIRANPKLGNAHAMRQAGVIGSKKHTQSLVDDELRDELDVARGTDPESIEAEIKRRGIDGVTEPIVSVKGEIVGERIVYSDRLLLALAKARHPAYRDTRQLEVSGPDGGPVQVQQGVSLSAVLGVLLAAGATPAGDSTGSPQAALPAARQVLPEPPDV